MLSVLALGFLIGLQHALEADHLAAVSTLAADQRHLRDFLRHGTLWGLGHSLTLLLVAGSALLFKLPLEPALARLLEALAGVMLVGLGGMVLARLLRSRVHFHVHSHGDGTRHVHAHSHGGETVPHGCSPHDHGHAERGWLRTTLVGIMHGLAGSASLVVLAAASLGSPGLGVLYIVLFGAGSVLGMAILSAAIALPLSLTARSRARALTWANQGLQGLIGGASIAIGLVMVQAYLW